MGSGIHWPRQVGYKKDVARPEMVKRWTGFVIFGALKGLLEFIPTTLRLATVCTSKSAKSCDNDGEPFADWGYQPGS